MQENILTPFNIPTGFVSINARSQITINSDPSGGTVSLGGSEIFIANTANNKLSFFGNQAVSQRTTADSTNPVTFAQNAGSDTDVVYKDSTFEGYTIEQIVKGLKDYGLFQ